MEHSSTFRSMDGTGIEMKIRTGNFPVEERKSVLSFIEKSSRRFCLEAAKKLEAEASQMKGNIAGDGAPGPRDAIPCPPKKDEFKEKVEKIALSYADIVISEMKKASNNQEMTSEVMEDINEGIRMLNHIANTLERIDRLQRESL